MMKIKVYHEINNIYYIEQSYEELVEAANRGHQSRVMGKFILVFNKNVDIFRQSVHSHKFNCVRINFGTKDEFIKYLDTIVNTKKFNKQMEDIIYED